MEQQIEFLFQNSRFHAEDVYVRGILPDLNIRFLFARMKNTLSEIRKVQNLSLQATALLGEVIMGAIILANREIKKEHEVVSIHIHGDGPVKKILVFANQFGGVRGILVPEDAEWEGELHAGKGKGVLQVNIFKQHTRKVYSSTVEMREVPVAKNIEEFISKSDQKNAFIGIYSEISEEPEIYGYFFEALPDCSFTQIEILLDFIRKTNMPDFLKHIFSETSFDVKKDFHESIRAEILQTVPVFFYCDCNVEKIENVLFTLGEKEIQELLQEQGKIEVTCEFCKKKYTFSENDIKRIFFQK